MLKVTVIAVAGKNIETILKTIKQEVSNINAGLDRLGDNTLVYMKDFINSHKKRKGKDPKARYPEGHLADSMDITKAKLAEGYSVGIGNIANLNSICRYWYVVNYGGYTPPSMRGYFGAGNKPDPSMKGVGTEPFISDKRYKMVYMSPIRPMHYIGGTLKQLNTRWDSYWTNFSKTNSSMVQIII